MCLTAVKGYQQIRYRVYYIMFNEQVFKNVYVLSCFGEVYALPFMSHVESSTSNSVNKRSNAF